MKKFIFAALIAAFASPAFAADLPTVITKGPKPRVLLTYAGSGFYYGIHTFAENQKIDVAGTTPGGGILSGLGGTFAVGAAVGATAGYMWGDGTSWKAVEVMASYKNIGGNTVVQDPVTGALIPGDVSSRISFTERVKIGGPLASVLNLLPNLSTVFPVLPSTIFPGAVASTTHPYLFGAAHQDDVSASFGLANGRAWRVKGGLGVGAMTQLSSGVVMDVWAEYIPAGKGIDLGAPSGSVSASNGRETRIGAAAYW